MGQPPKPWRPPKAEKDMERGRTARRRGKKYQKILAEFLGMLNRWPLPGIDIEGKIFTISAKSREENFPKTVETWLEEAEIHTLKKRPDATAVLVIHKTGADKRDETGKFMGIREDLVVMRLETFRWIKESIGR